MAVQLSTCSECQAIYMLFVDRASDVYSSVCDVSGYL